MRESVRDKPQETAAQARAPRVFWILLAASLALNTISPFWGKWNGDELGLKLAQMQGIAKWEFWDIYPPLHVYILKIFVLEPVEWFHRFFHLPHERVTFAYGAQNLEVVWLARLVAGAMGSATAAAIFFLTRRLYGGVAALFAMAWVVFCPTFINLAHFSTADIPSVFWGVLCVALLAKAADDPRPRWFVFAGLACAAAAATKYLAGGVGIAIIAVLAKLFRETKDAKLIARRGAAMMATALLGFVAFHPYSLIKPAKFKQDLKFLAEKQRNFAGADQPLGIIQIPKRTIEINGWMMPMLALGGFALSLRAPRTRFAAGLLGLAAISQYAALASSRFIPYRYAIIFTPLLAPFAGFAFDELRLQIAECVSERRIVAARRVGRVLVVAVFLLPFLKSAYVPYLFAWGDSRLRVVREALDLDFGWSSSVTTSYPNIIGTWGGGEWYQPELPGSRRQIDLTGEHEWPFGVASQLLAFRPVALVSAEMFDVRPTPPFGFKVRSVFQPQRWLGPFTPRALEFLEPTCKIWTGENYGMPQLGESIRLASATPGRIELYIDTKKPPRGIAFPKLDVRLDGEVLAWTCESSNRVDKGRIFSILPPASGTPLRNVEIPLASPFGRQGVTLQLLHVAGPAVSEKLEDLIGPVDLIFDRDVPSPAQAGIDFFAPPAQVLDYKNWDSRKMGEGSRAEVEEEGHLKLNIEREKVKFGMLSPSFTVPAGKALLAETEITCLHAYFDSISMILVLKDPRSGRQIERNASPDRLYGNTPDAPAGGVTFTLWAPPFAHDLAAQILILGTPNDTPRYFSSEVFDLGPLRAYAP